jgi:pimeloyl-ACP methyl ester carboxylesterase
MIREFTMRGYPPAYLHAVDLIPNDGANVRAARLFVAQAADSLLDRAAVEARRAGVTALEKATLDIVAHSMGAVSGRWYTSRIAPERVRTFVSIAGSNHGTDALCGHRGEGNHEMCPAFAGRVEESRMQVELNGTSNLPVDETFYGIGPDAPGVDRVPPDAHRRIAYFTIRIEPDRWIKPESSALLAGAGGAEVQPQAEARFRETQPGNYLLEGAAGHDDLPKVPEVMALVAALLASRDSSEEMAECTVSAN